MNSRVRHELLLYFSITISITWLIWLPPVMNNRGVDVPVILLILANLASFTPTVVGLLLHRRYLGKKSYRSDMKKRLSWKFSKTWLLSIPVFFLGLGGLSYGLTLILVKEFQPTNVIPVMMTPLIFLQILLVGGAVGEEFGWRGFAQPRLQKLLSPFAATLILGLIWSLWHLPLFFMEGTVQSNMPIWQFMVQNTLIAFFYTWLYMRTEGNLWLMIYLHAVANTSAAIFPYWQSELGRFIGLGVLLVACMALYVFFPVRGKKSVPSWD